jgi:hypothetical protein
MTQRVLHPISIPLAKPRPIALTTVEIGHSSTLNRGAIAFPGGAGLFYG